MSFYFEYKLTPLDYRRMTYFNTFSIKRFQGIFVILAWIAAFGLLMLAKLGALELTHVTYICCLVVSVCVPMLVLSLEFSIYKFRINHCGADALLRKMIVNQDGVRYANEGDQSSHLEKWQDIIRVFERKEQFIFYKDAKRATVLPKSAVPVEKLEEFRMMISQKLGEYYVRRDG